MRRPSDISCPPGFLGTWEIAPASGWPRGLAGSPPVFRPASPVLSAGPQATILQGNPAIEGMTSVLSHASHEGQTALALHQEPRAASPPQAGCVDCLEQHESPGKMGVDDHTALGHGRKFFQVESQNETGPRFWNKGHMSHGK